MFVEFMDLHWQLIDDHFQKRAESNDLHVELKSVS